MLNRTNDAAVLAAFRDDLKAIEAGTYEAPLPHPCLIPACQGKRVTRQKGRKKGAKK